MIETPNSPDHETGTGQSARRFKADSASTTGESKKMTCFMIEQESSAGLDTEVNAQNVKREDDSVVARVGRLQHDVGWILIAAGIVGMIVPGIPGTPFVLMGAYTLWPGNRKRVENWRKGHTPKIFHGCMKQINRFLDDLERRYPRIEKH